MLSTDCICVLNMSQTKQRILPPRSIKWLIFGRIRKIVKLSVNPSVLPSTWQNSAPTGRIFIKFDIWRVFENPSKKLKLHYNLTSPTGASHEDQYTYFIISLSFLRTINVSNKAVEKIKTHILWSVTLKSCAVYEKIWKNNLEPDRPQMTIWCMRISCWINKATVGPVVQSV
jgi:hypothetical protein